MTLLSEARQIAKKYGVTLPRAWRGYILVWHPWHRAQDDSENPAHGLIFRMTFREFLSRIVEIENNKPEAQRAERIRLMRPVQFKFPKDELDAQQAKLDAQWVKLDAQRVKLDAQQAKLDAQWDAEHRAEILLAHAAECPGCKWDGRKLPQFE